MLDSKMRTDTCGLNLMQGRECAPRVKLSGVRSPAVCPFA
jgi:hypothetical protein